MALSANPTFKHCQLHRTQTSCTVELITKAYYTLLTDLWKAGTTPLMPSVHAIKEMLQSTGLNVFLDLMIPCLIS